MLRLLLVAALVAVVSANWSPNADYINQISSAQPGARFSDNVLEDAILDVPGLVTKYGYPIEIHNVTTEDGYQLTMHRIPYGRDQNNQPDPNKPIAFLMHGLVASSAEFIMIGPGSALAYLLAEEGYDVWIGNARGNFYSRRHTTLNPNNRLNPAYWRFSWDEIGNYDLPAFIDYIELVTGNPKLHYIAHSQGCTTFIVLASLRPEYNEKFISFQAMAPAVFFTNNDNLMYQALAPLASVIEPATFVLTGGEIFPNRAFVSWFASVFCYQGSIFSPLCTTFLVSGQSQYLNQTMIPVYLGHSPAGSSIRQANHFAQCINQDTFRRFDFGAATNLQRYGSVTPPDYNLSLVTTPTYIHYAQNDDAANPLDVELLGSRLPDAQLRLVDSEDFGHLDFLWSLSSRELLYEAMIAFMREAESL